MEMKNEKDVWEMARRGDARALEEEITGKHADVNVVDVRGYTLLHAACDEGRKEIVEILIRADADVNKQGEDGWTPLHSACDEGHKEIVEILIRADADAHRLNK